MLNELKLSLVLANECLKGALFEEHILLFDQEIFTFLKRTVHFSVYSCPLRVSSVLNFYDEFGNIYLIVV